jgi:molybdopterin synthase sulfur carrier subunit
MISVAFFATFRKVTSSKYTEVPDRVRTVRDLLFLLADRYGKAFRSLALTENGEISPDIMILINGRDVAHLGNGEARVTSGDEVSLFPRLAGG